MQQRSFSYFALLDAENSPGVAKKLMNTVKAATELGLEAEEHFYPQSCIGALNFLKALVDNRSRYIYIRYSLFLFPILFVILLVKRLQGAKILIDVPTPRASVLREFDVTESNRGKRFIKKLLTLLSASWVFFPANVVVQYGEESKWFYFGVKRKSKLVANGIDLTDIKVNPINKIANLNLIGVAQLANWHGYDRVIRAIAELKHKHNATVNFTVVGEGTETSALRLLTNELGIKNQVVFTGDVIGVELDRLFEASNIGVASLGLFRKNLDLASDLKTREYVSRGLIVIAAGKDLDFPAGNKIRHVVPNDESIKCLVELLLKLSREDLMSPNEVRRYAEQNLTLKMKLSYLLNVAEKNVL